MEEEKTAQKKASPVPSKAKSRRKFFLVAIITAANLFGAAVGSIAWFDTVAKNANVSAVAGDMMIQPKKVTAYKYVYPYYSGDTEFINYDSVGAIKKYVVEDTSIEGADSASDTALTFSLGINSTATTCYNKATLGNDDVATATHIHYHYNENYGSDSVFRYFLLGNETFIGSAGVDYSTVTVENTHNAFVSKSDYNRQGTEQDPLPTIQDVVVSAGSEFILFDASTVAQSNCSYFTYSAPNVANPRFVALDDNGTAVPYNQQGNVGTRLKCLKAGIYTFSIGQNGLTITLQNDRSDESIIGNGKLDAAKISIDYYGMSPEEKTAAGYSGMSEYYPKAIHDQNAMVIFDIELECQNVNPITAELQIRRTSSGTDDNAIYKLENHYSNATYNKQGYDGTNRNPMHASDFYCYKASIPNVPYASATALWNALHQENDLESNLYNGFVRFQDTGFDYENDDYETFIDCPLNGGNPYIIPGHDASAPVSFHCYIAVDYDPLHIKFFMDENRLGNTFFLDRDFVFYFKGTESLETPAPSPFTITDSKKKEERE